MMFDCFRISISMSRIMIACLVECLIFTDMFTQNRMINILMFVAQSYCMTVFLFGMNELLTHKEIEVEVLRNQYRGEVQALISFSVDDALRKISNYYK
jgi:hypothetical protein